MDRRRQRRGAGVSRTHATEGESNGIQNGSTINGNTNETSPANATPNVNVTADATANVTPNVTANGTPNATPNATANVTPNATANVTPNVAPNVIDNIHNPSLPEGRKTVRVLKGLFHNSSECSRQITRIFKERIDEEGYTWTKVSQSTKNFYFGEFKKHFVWDLEIETNVRGEWDSKASSRYTDFLRDIRDKNVKPVFMSDDAWRNFTSYWGTPKYKEIQAKNTQNRLKGEGSSTHTGGSISFHEHAQNLESLYKRPHTGFELFLHTHTSGHDKKTFINEESKTVDDNVVRLRQEKGGNSASAESQVDETTLYIAAASGAKKRNLYGAGSKRADYLIDSGTETTAISKADDDGWEKKSMKMERTINKLNKTLEIVCSRFNITLPDCDSDTEDNNVGDAHQGPNTSQSGADGHDNHMIVSS